MELAGETVLPIDSVVVQEEVGNRHEEELQISHHLPCADEAFQGRGEKIRVLLLSAGRKGPCWKQLEAVFQRS
jgi:hypothetical protein